ncbi:MAG: hypothetical protein JSW61_10135 [Candidatus Thorarchaeota archaeon]|nr:MAG: hypothetical protein JSW61_10135 [Candidatus Thorarchaeota archaeon]
MRVLGNASGVDILAPDDAYFSFFDSPYPGHELRTAVDIYPAHREWNGPAFSPVDGTVVKIKKIKMGRKKQFASEAEDYGIGIQPIDYESLLVRVLHCRPNVKEGDSVEAGDEIGSIVRSRFFCRWTGAHYHVEVMKDKHFVRSTKSSVLQTRFKPGTLHGSFGGWPLAVEVLEVGDDFMVAYCPRIQYIKSGDLRGHAAFSGHSGNFGILDAGIAHYSFGGLHGLADYGSGDVVLWNTLIGLGRSERKDSFVFDSNERLRFMLNGDEIHGLSFFTLTRRQSHRGSPPITLIPRKPLGFRKSATVGDVLELSSVLR